MKERERKRLIFIFISQIPQKIFFLVSDFNNNNFCNMNARQHQCGSECNIVINLFATSNTDKHTHTNKIPITCKHQNYFCITTCKYDGFNKSTIIHQKQAKKKIKWHEQQQQWQRHKNYICMSYKITTAVATTTRLYYCSSRNIINKIK